MNIFERMNKTQGETNWFQIMKSFEIMKSVCCLLDLIFCNTEIQYYINRRNDYYFECKWEIEVELVEDDDDID
jgi:hypothetical protein